MTIRASNIKLQTFHGSTTWFFREKKNKNSFPRLVIELPPIKQKRVHEAIEDRTREVAPC